MEIQLSLKELALLSLLLSSLILCFYTLQIASENKALCSISDSNYWLKKPWLWTFEAVMFAMGLSLVFNGLVIGKEPIWLLISGGVGVFFVGVFSRFKDNNIVQWCHNTSAFIGFGSILISLWLAFSFFWMLLIEVIIFLLTLYYSAKRKVFIWNVENNLIYTGLFFLILCIYLSIKNNI